MIAALIPAAGSSSRMGQPKLLLQFEGQTLIGRLVSALKNGGIRHVVVVAPPRNVPEGPGVAAEAQLAGAEVLVPLERPASMRASIELGLKALVRQHTPQSLMLTPGDFPGLSAEVVGQLLAYATEMPERIVIPTHKLRRGHPIVLPWRIAAQIPSLPVTLGVNALVARHSELVAEREFARQEVITDLDTRDDLDQWLRQLDAGERVIEHTARPISEAGSPIPNIGHRSPTIVSDSVAASRFRICVRLFALAKDRAGQPELEIDLNHGSTVRDLRSALGETKPALIPLLSTALFAVDEEYASDDTTISPKSRVAVIPPVSGGAGG
jgi:molybdenum cofactor cytidylyltransferase